MAPEERLEADLALAARCVAGDRAAQRELFHRELDRVHAILHRVLGAARDLEDVVQEAMIEIFRSLPRYRGEALLGTWIDRITTRVAWAYLARRPRPTAPLEAVPHVPSHDLSAERRLLDREAARRLYGALDRLPPEQRIAFALHVIDGRPLKEVARAMDASLVATKTRVWRARRELDKRARRDPVLADFLGVGADRDPDRELGGDGCA